MTKRHDERQGGPYVVIHHGSRLTHVIITHLDADHLTLINQDKLGAWNRNRSADEMIALLASYKVQLTTGIDIERVPLARAVTRPGIRMTRLTQFGMTAEAHRSMVWPAMQDAQFEYAVERNAGHQWCALFTLIRGYASVLSGWLYGLIAQALKRTNSAFTRRP